MPLPALFQPPLPEPGMRHFGHPALSVPQDRGEEHRTRPFMDNSQYGLQSASRGPPRPGFRTPAALPPVDGFPALRVLRRLRRPAPRGATGDPTFPWCWTSRARRRCPVRPLEWGHSPSSTTWKVQATTTLSPYRGGPDVRRYVGGRTLVPSGFAPACRRAGDWGRGAPLIRGDEECRVRIAVRPRRRSVQTGQPMAIGALSFGAGAAGGASMSGPARC